MSDTDRITVSIPDVKVAQAWLNNVYGNNENWKEIDEDGIAGYYTMVAFVRALQIELGIDVDGGFGNSTKAAFNNLFPNGLGTSTEINTLQKENIVVLINASLVCRIEVSNTEDAYVYSSATAQGITSMMSQLGINNFTGNITAKEVKALMTSDAYYLISGGDATTREIQQALNRKYSDAVGGYIATNGLYDRNMNTAIIKAIQHEIGVDVDGGWGEGTKSALPVLGAGSSRTNLVYILQYLLYLNGFDPNGFDGGFGNGVTSALKNFQTLMKLDVDGYCGRQAWSALVVSCGDTARSANACDTCFEITPARAQLLKNNGYGIVGRYLTGYISDTRPKALQEGELETILNAGLKAFIIYQENNRQISDFSYDKGVRAAIEACTAARQKNVPKDTIIYFAVDLDVYEDQIDDYIIPFFRGINAFINFRYKVGIYGPRLVCQRVSDYGLAESSFVADMSSGYSCNVGQKIPNNWNYDQFKEISNYGNELDIDKVTYRGIVEPVSTTETVTYPIETQNAETISYLRRIYNIAKEYYMLHNENQVDMREINSLVLQYIALKEYDTLGFNLLASYDSSAVSYIASEIGEDKRSTMKLYNNDYGIWISLPHLAISTHMILARGTGVLKIDATVSDLCSWAGDLLSLAKNYTNVAPGTDLDDLADEIFNQIATDNESLFGKEDFIQDLDAWNLYKGLIYFPIYDVFDSYYNVDSTHRARKFIDVRTEYGNLPAGINKNSGDFKKMYSLAKEYLNMDISDLEGLAATAFNILINETTLGLADGIVETIATQFATKVIDMLSI